MEDSALSYVSITFAHDKYTNACYARCRNMSAAGEVLLDMNIRPDCKQAHSCSLYCQMAACKEHRAVCRAESAGVAGST